MHEQRESPDLRSRRPAARTAALALLLLAGCGGEAEPPSPPPARRAAPVTGLPALPDRGDQTVQAAEGGTAVIACERDTAKFGEVWEGSILRDTFLLEAAGAEDLVIQRVKPGCSCTLVELSVLGAEGERFPYELGTRVPIGTELELVAELDTHGKRGQQVKGVQIVANVPGGVRDLLLVADVRPWLEVTPRQWLVQRLSTNERRETTIRVLGATAEPFRLTAGQGLTHPTGALPEGQVAGPISGCPEGFEIELVPVDPEPDGRAREWKANLAFGPGARKGHHVFTVPLLTDVVHPLGRPQADGSPAVHNVELTVSAEVVGVVTSSPAYVSFGMVAPDQVVSRTVRVSCSDPAFELAEPVVHLETLDGSPSPQAGSIQVTPRRVEGQNAWDLELVLDGLPAGLAETDRSFKGRVRIETGHPVEGELMLTFSGFVRRPTPGG